MPCFRQLRTRGHACHHWLYCSRVLPTARLLQPLCRPGVFVRVCVSRMHPRSREVSLPRLFEQTPRVAMLADRVVLGFNRVTARCELVIFLPALSDLKFADIPNGVQALYKMPAEAAWLGGMCRRVLCFCASASGNLEPSLVRFHGEPGSLHAVNPQTSP